MDLKFFLRSFILLILSSFQTLANNYTWNGGNSDWSTSSNWTPSSVPTSSDTVTIVSGTIQVASDVSINVIIMTGGEIQLNSHRLNLSGAATFNGCTISNGTLIVLSTNTFISDGSNINCKTSISSNAIYIKQSVFGDSLSIVKKGSSVDVSKGGNVFNSFVSLVDSGSGIITFGDSLRDIFNQKVYINIPSTGRIYLANKSFDNIFNGELIIEGGYFLSNANGTAFFNDNITFNNTYTNGSSISFGSGTGTAQLTHGKTVRIGTRGFSQGSIFFKNFNFLDSTYTMDLNMSGTGRVLFESCTINSQVNASSYYLYLKNSRFNRPVSFTQFGGTSFSSPGGNVFMKDVNFTNNSSFAISLSIASVDSFYSKATFRSNTQAVNVNNAVFQDSVFLVNSCNLNTGVFLSFASTGLCKFKKHVSIDNSYSTIAFGNSSGTAVCDSTCSVTIKNTSSGYLIFRGFSKLNSSPFVISNSTLNRVTLGPNSLINGDFNFYGQNISLNGCIFNGMASISRFGTASESSIGGNIFNENFTFQDSSSITHTYNFGSANPNYFNKNVNLIRKGNGTIYVGYIPCYFRGDLSVNGANVIFGYTNASKAVFDGSGYQKLYFTGGSNIKKGEVNKNTGLVQLLSPITIADSIRLVKGIILTDTTSILIVNDNAKILGGSDSSYVEGPVRKIGNDAFTFPLGSRSKFSPYHPISISAPSQVTDVIQSNYISTPYSILAGDSILVNPEEYWSLKQISGNSSLICTLDWNANSRYTNDSANLSLCKFALNKWVGIGSSILYYNSSSGRISSLQNQQLSGGGEVYLNIGKHMNTVASSAVDLFPYRGLYINRFIRDVDTPLPFIYVLGNQAREDEILAYARDNNIKRIDLYNLRKMFISPWQINSINPNSNNTFGDDLCNFIDKAHNQFCIEQVCAIGSAREVFADVNGVPRPQLSSPYNIDNSTIPNLRARIPSLDFLNSTTITDDDKIVEAELMKLFLNVIDFNNSRGGGTGLGCRFDVMTTEIEFWWPNRYQQPFYFPQISFSTSSNTLISSTVLNVSSTAGLSLGIRLNIASGTYFHTFTHIVAINSATQITISLPTVNPIPANTQITTAFIDDYNYWTRFLNVTGYLRSLQMGNNFQIHNYIGGRIHPFVNYDPFTGIATLTSEQSVVDQVDANSDRIYLVDYQGQTYNTWSQFGEFDCFPHTLDLFGHNSIPTIISPLFSSEDRSGSPFLGNWLSNSIPPGTNNESHTIQNYEKTYFYDPIVPNSPQSQVIGNSILSVGSSQWFSSIYMRQIPVFDNNLNIFPFQNTANENDFMRYCTNNVAFTFQDPNQPTICTTPDNVARFCGLNVELNYCSNYEPGVFCDWEWGDGSFTIHTPSDPLTSNQSHTYPQPGNYTITCHMHFPGSGCTYDYSRQVIMQNVTLSSTLVQPTCNLNDGSITLSAISTGTSPYAYSISGSANASNTTGIFNNLPAGNYTCTITEAGGCTAAAVVILSSTSLSVAISTTDATCYNGTNGSATATVTGGTAPYIYSWGTSSVNQGISAGQYLVTVTDVNNCSGSASYTISQPIEIIVTATQMTLINCNNGTANVVVSATGYVGQPQGIGNFTSIAGTFIYTVTDANNCSATTSITISQPQQLTAVATINSPILCNGGTASIVVSAYGGTPFYVGTGNFNVGPGTYTYTVTDAKSCVATVSITITQPTVLNAQITGGPILCNGGTTILTVSGTGGTPSYTGIGSYTVSQGIHSYTVSDNNGCTATTSVNLSEPTALSVTVSCTNCPPSTNGTANIIAQATGGTTGYSYSWANNLGTSSSVSNLFPGTYTVTVTDANGCTASSSIIIDAVTAICGSVTLPSNTIHTNNSTVNSASTLIGYTPGSSRSTIAIHANFIIDVQNFTIANTDVYIDPGFSIIINPNCNLTITDGSILRSCTGLWQGIILSSSSSSIVINNSSTIQDAVIGIDASNGAHVAIDGSYFLHSGTNISIKNYNITGSPISIQNSVFTGGGLIPSVGIAIKDLTGTLIINGGNSNNTLNDLAFGVQIYSSNVKLEKFIFNNINCLSNNGCGINRTAAIYVTANANIKLVVGGSLANKCIFNNCKLGIFCFKKVELDITFNDFAQAASPNLITTGIYSILTQGCPQSIQYNNFSYIWYGIDIKEAKNEDVLIRYNSFNNFVSNNYQSGTAIQFRNTSQNTSGNRRIEGNFIRHYLRGIYLVSQSKTVYVTENTIYIDNLNPTSFMLYGIRIQNCTFPNEITNNTISKIGNSSSTFENAVVGITIENSESQSIVENELINCGTGVRIWSNTSNETIQCNAFMNNYQHFSMTNATIGSQGTSNASQDNTFENGLYTSPYKLRGYATNTPTIWYHQQTGYYDILSSEVLPVNNFILSTGQTNSNCTPPCLSLLCTQGSISKLLQDVINNTEVDENTKYRAASFVFQTIRLDTSILHLSTDEDIILQEFYYSTLDKNIEMLVELLENIQFSDTITARYLISAINPENQAEENQNTVSEIYLNSWSKDQIELDSLNNAELNFIAEQNPNDDGFAVYAARVMLGLDLDDFIAETERKGKDSRQKINLINGFTIYPNPTSGLFEVVFTDKIKYSDCIFTLSNLLGKSIQNIKFNWSESRLKIDGTELADGIYILNIFESNQWLGCEKIIINH